MSPDMRAQLLQDTSLVYFDGRLTLAAAALAKAASEAGIPVLVEAERVREDLEQLLQWADYVVTSKHFPQASAELSLDRLLCEPGVPLPTVVGSGRKFQPVTSNMLILVEAAAVHGPCLAALGATRLPGPAIDARSCEQPQPFEM